MTLLLVNDSDFVENRSRLPFEEMSLCGLKRPQLEQDCDVIALVRDGEIYLLKNRHGKTRRFVLLSDLVLESTEEAAQ